MKFEDFFFGDENFVVFVLQLFRDSWGAGFSFVAGDKDIFSVESNVLSFVLLNFLILSRTLTERRGFVERTVFTEKDLFKFLRAG